METSYWIHIWTLYGGVEDTKGFGWRKTLLEFIYSTTNVDRQNSAPVRGCSETLYVVPFLGNTTASE